MTPSLDLTVGDLSLVRLDYLALIDSGADFNIFHASIAEVLNIDLTKLNKTSFYGIHAGITGIGHWTVLDIGIAGDFHQAPVLFSHDISNSGFGILGQKGFFEFYKVKLDYAARHIELRKNMK